MARISAIYLHPGFCRFFEKPILELARRGHDVSIVFLGLKKKKSGGFEGEEIVRTWSAEGRIHMVFPDKLPKDLFGSAKRQAFFYALRSAVDFARYFHPRYREAGLLRERAFEAVEPRGWAKFVKGVYSALPWAVIQLLQKALLKFDELIAPPEKFVALVRSLKPDCVLFAPYVDLGSQLTDVVKTGRRLHIPSILTVASWDNLTNKGLVKLHPDWVFVWNESQRAEASAFHKLPKGKVVPLGAPSFEDWFDFTPSQSRESFLAKLGLDPSKKTLLYLGSSPFIAPQEVDFFLRWRETVRKSGAFGDFQILLRPHPQNFKQWLAVDERGLQDVVVFPKQGAFVVDSDSRRDFFESLYYCDAVVGINTSSMIEANILGKPVFTILDPLFSGTQEGTLHFSYLTSLKFVQQAASLEEHSHQLNRTLSEIERAENQNVHAFLWPDKSDKPSRLIASKVETIATGAP